MRGVTITRHGPPSVLEVHEFPDPEPGSGQIRIDVRAAGLNFAEVTARQGLYPDAPKPPCVVGYEVAGVVDALGAGVDQFAIGDRVMAMTRFGGHASKVAVDVGFAVRLPDDLDFVNAAAIPVNYLTAHHMLFYIGTVHPHSRVLVHMAAGGVGTAAIQLLKTVEGVEIFGTASASKHDYLRELGCDHPIDYRTRDYASVIQEQLDGEGLDIILDALGGKDWKRGWELLAPTGRLVAFGFANVIDGSQRKLLHVARALAGVLILTPMQAMDHNRSLQGVNMGHLWNERRRLSPQLERIVQLWKEGVVRPHVHEAVPFAEAARAHELLEARANRGKLVLVP